MIHRNYERLTDAERAFVDGMFSRDAFAAIKSEFGYVPSGDDKVEIAIEAVATWLIESSESVGLYRVPTIREGTRCDIEWVLPKH